MERIVIVAYKPFPDKSEDLRELVKEHWHILKTQDLVSDRSPVLMEAKDGSIVEVFGWKSKEAIESAHSNPSVQQLWERFSEVCTYIPVSKLEEADDLFSEFTPI